MTKSPTGVHVVFVTTEDSPVTYNALADVKHASVKLTFVCLQKGSMRTSAPSSITTR